MSKIDLRSIPTQSDFVAWWKALPRTGDGHAPALADCLDGAHPGFAPWIVIVDVVNDFRLPIRLFGTRLTEFFGERTATDYLDHMPPSLRKPIALSHKAMCAMPCGRLTEAYGVTGSGRDIVLDMVSLPLSSPGNISHVIKFTRIVEQLDVQEGLSRVNRIFMQTWLDIGAGVPETPCDALG